MCNASAAIWAEAWFPGLKRPSTTLPNIVVRSAVQHLLDRQSRPLLQGIRYILPTWKTTPKAALYKESGFPPINQHLEALQLRFSVRLQRLDYCHPLVHRSKLPPTTPRSQIPWNLRYRAPPIASTYLSRLQRTAAILAVAMVKVPRPLLPLKELVNQMQISSKEATAKSFLLWLAQVTADDVIIYSDGSQHYSKLSSIVDYTAQRHAKLLIEVESVVS